MSGSLDSLGRWFRHAHTWTMPAGRVAISEDSVHSEIAVTLRLQKRVCYLSLMQSRFLKGLLRTVQQPCTQGAPVPVVGFAAAGAALSRISNAMRGKLKLPPASSITFTWQ